MGLEVNLLENKSQKEQDKILADIKNDIRKSTDLYRQAAQSNIFFIGTPCKGVLGELGSSAYCFVAGNDFEGYYHADDLDNAAKKIVSESRKSGKYIDAYYAKLKMVFSRMLILFSELEKTDFAVIPIGHLKSKLGRLDSLNYEFWHNGFLVDKFDPNGEKFLAAEIKKQNLDIGREAVDMLIKPHSLNFIELADLKLYEIAKGIKKHSIKEKKFIALKLDAFIKEFYFIRNSWGTVCRLTTDDFIPTVIELSKKALGEIDDEVRRLKNLTKKRHEDNIKIIKKFSVNKELQNIFYLYRMLALIRDERKEYVLRCNHFYEAIAERLAKEYSVEKKIVYNALAQEIIHQDIEELLPLLIKRNTGFMIVTSDNDNPANSNLANTDINNPDTINNPIDISGSVAKGLTQLLLKRFEEKYTDIKGMAACTGKASGKVKIVLGETHFTKFEKGDVLVAVMTRPEYMPLMKKAAAIVTDEGGITCHAAIVARELKIPCIVGTQVATKRLYDNLTVEVDAYTGKVKIVSK